MRIVLTVFFSLHSFFLHAQESPFSKPGKLKPEHFQQLSAFEGNVAAVVLYDKGQTAIEGNDKGWFSAVFNRRKLIQVINKDGYQYADVQINLFTKNGVEERLFGLRAVTYNLDKGKVVAVPLEKSGIFRVKQDKNRQVVRFAMPHVKEGSIIEFEYTVKTDYYWQIEPWYFQDDIPTLWSEYVFSVPQFFTYTSLSKGYQPFLINTKKESRGFFRLATVNRTGATIWKNFSSGVTDFRWVKKDVAPVKEENFTSSIQNHITGIEFTLASQNLPLEPRDFRLSWADITDELLQSVNFGKNLNNNFEWLNEEMKPLPGDEFSETHKAQKIFTFVRDNFHCTSHSSIYTERSLKDVFKTRRGNVAEINLLLTAMLRNAGVKADPVILSRRDNGFVYENYPTLEKFNYVIVRATTDSATQFLDASEPIGFGKLLADCYNGYARVINDSASSVFLLADSVIEKKVTTVYLTAGNEGKWKGNVTQVPGYYESFISRGIVKEKGAGMFFKQLQERMGPDATISDGAIDSLHVYESPVSIRYKIEVPIATNDVISFNPMLGEGYAKNPFTSSERLYPVEMPYLIDDSFVLQLEVPAGYEVDKLPKQIIARLDEEGKSFFEYRVHRSGNVIILRSSLKLSKTFFEPEEYVALKKFFDLIAEKHNAHFVFKKKKDV